jgi:hypothetical protein
MSRLGPSYYPYMEQTTVHENYIGNIAKANRE